MRRGTQIWMIAIAFGLMAGCGGFLDQDSLSGDGDDGAPAAESETEESEVDDSGSDEGVVEQEDSDGEEGDVVVPADDDSATIDEAVSLDSDDSGEPEAADIVDPESPEFPAEALMSQSHASEEAEFLSLLNAERNSHGLGSLKTFWDLENDARSHSETMASQNDLHHNPELASVTSSSNWTRIGENVGRGPAVQSIHDAFMNSPGHRDNILGDYSHVGIGVTTSGSTIWVTVVFMKAAISGLENTYAPFVDDLFNTHEANIQKIYEAGITHGCSGGDRPRYCPDDHVTRGQMAAFLDRALDLPDANQNYFNDTNGAFYEDHANRLKAAGITHGCGNGNYCGDQAVTRAQMASFLARALDL